MGKYEINFVRFVRVRSMEEKYPQWQNDLFTPARIEIVFSQGTESESEGAFYTVHSKICCVIPGT